MEETKVEDNEFESIDDSEAVPESGYPEEEESLINNKPAGQKYDYNSAPEGTKAPPRVDMDGKEIVVTSAEIYLPPESKEWTVPKKEGSTARYKACSFQLNYDFENQREYYSGMKVFKSENDKYSHPTISKGGVRLSQATKLMMAYAKFKEKDINDVSLKEFLSFLNSKPKAKIKAEEVINPQTGEKVMKNFVGEFLA